MHLVRCCQAQNFFVFLTPSSSTYAACPRIKTMCMIRRISKKELAIIFGFYSRGSGRAKTQRLREEVFTDLVLAEIGITKDTYRRRRIFMPTETAKIVDYFQIKPNELEALVTKKV